MDVIRKLILNKYPDYDFDRYRFKSGDIVRTLDGALVCVRESALEYVDAFPIVRSMRIREKVWQRVPYTDLPFYTKGEFVSLNIKPTTSVKWKVGDFVTLDYEDSLALLTEEHKDRHQAFYAYVLRCSNNYYLHTGIYVENPMKDYC